MILVEKLHPCFSAAHKMPPVPPGVKQEARLSITLPLKWLKIVACFENTKLIQITITLCHPGKVSLYLQPLRKCVALIASSSEECQAPPSLQPAHIISLNPAYMSRLSPHLLDTYKHRQYSVVLSQLLSSSLHPSR